MRFPNPFRAPQVETKGAISSPANAGGWLSVMGSIFGGMTTAAGVQVTPTSAMASGNIALSAAMRIISETVASCDIDVVMRAPDGTVTEIDHPLARTLRNPNPLQTGFEFKETLVNQLLCYGESICFLNKDHRGDVVEIIPLRPGQAHMYIAPDGSIYYALVRGNLLTDPFIDESDLIATDRFMAPARCIAHFRAGALYPMSPVSILRAGAESIGAAIASDRQAGGLFARAATPSGILKATGKLSAEALARLRISWDGAHAGASNAYRTAILEEGMTFESMTPDLTKLQLLESRRFNVEEVARLFRIPLHKLSVSSGQPRANVEAEAVGFLTDCIGPWLERIEDSLVKYCLVPQDIERGITVEFDEDDLVRTDFATRTAGLAAGRMGGWLSPNDCRRAMGYPPVENGDDISAPLNSNHNGAAAPTDTTAPAADPEPTKAYSRPENPSPEYLLREAEIENLKATAESHRAMAAYFSADTKESDHA